MVLNLVIFIRCQQDNEEILKPVVNDLKTQNEAIDLMAKALAKGMENIDFRELIRYETNKQFDYDYDVLYRFIKDKEIKDGKGNKVKISEFLLKQIENEITTSNVNMAYIKNIDQYIPNLNICVPFQYKNWDPSEFIPPVASFPVDFDEKTHTQVKAFDSSLNMSWLTKAEQDWEKPVVTVGLSERVDENGLLIVNAGSLVIEKEFRKLKADDAYEVASSYLKSGKIEEFIPFVQVVNDMSKLKNKLLCQHENVKNNEKLDQKSSYSNAKSFNGGTSLPRTPKIMKLYPAVGITNGLHIEWDDTLNITQYELWRSVNSGSFGAQPYCVFPNTSQSYTDYYLQNGSTYSYKVRAKNSNGYSAFSPSVSMEASYRHGNGVEQLSQMFIDKDCWNDISWGRSKVECYVKIIKYDVGSDMVTYPQINFGQKDNDDQKGLWCNYNVDLFRWDMRTSVLHYWLYFYEKDSGWKTKVTIGQKSFVKFPVTEKAELGMERTVNVEFEIGFQDDAFGFIEIYDYTRTDQGISTNPPKGSAIVKITNHL